LIPPLVTNNKAGSEQSKADCWRQGYGQIVGSPGVERDLSIEATLISAASPSGSDSPADLGGGEHPGAELGEIGVALKEVVVGHFVMVIPDDTDVFDGESG